MLIQGLATLLSMSSLVSAAALLPARQASTPVTSLTQQDCMATTYSYITVTVTDTPTAVTVAVPDMVSVSRSLASVSSIDSLVVVENSQDRPFNAPPNTVVPTFIKTINAPAVELTEIPHTGSSVIYLPGTKPVTTVPIQTSTESIIVPPIGGGGAPITTANPQAASRLASSLSKDYTVPAGGWNGTFSNATNIPPHLGTVPTASRDLTSTLTQVTYISTTTFVTDTTVTPEVSYSAPAYGASSYGTPSYGTPSYEAPSYGSSSYGDTSPSSQYSYSDLVKRQTCTLISAEISGHWASWCNNWDGASTLTYTSWETTVTPQAASTPSVAGDSGVASPTSPSAGPSANPTPSMAPPSCGETGPFNIGFDDLPRQSVSSNSDAGLPPIFNPYRHFYWADGWSYLPPPNDPYPPQNGNTLAIYVPPSQPNTVPDSTSNLTPIGGFGAGPRSYIDAYWFNAQSAWVGCDNNVTDPSGQCDFVAEAYIWDAQAKNNRIVTSQHFPLDLCHTTSCPLQQITFNQQFVGISTIGFYARIGGSIHTFYIDDLQLSWSNNSCEAGSLRASSRK